MRTKPGTFTGPRGRIDRKPLAMAAEATSRVREPLLREALGAALRGVRVRKGISLRDLAVRSTVSSGYLSELERGQKEVSSELLVAVCQAMNVRVSDVLLEAISLMAVQELSREHHPVRQPVHP